MEQADYLADKHSHFHKKPKLYTDNPEVNLLKGKDVVYPPTQQEILMKGLEIKEDELRALYFYLYQTGARISEALALKYGDIIIQSQDRHRYASVRCITLKNRTQGVRQIPIPLFLPMEAQMFAYFNQTYEHRIGNIFKEQLEASGNAESARKNIWFKFSSGADKISFIVDVLDFKTRRISKREVKLHPHLLRHFRLTHLVTLYNYSAMQLQQFAGWSSVSPASVYVSLSSGDLATQFIRPPKFNTKVYSFASSKDKGVEG